MKDESLILDHEEIRILIRALYTFKVSVAVDPSDILMCEDLIKKLEEEYAG